MKTLKDAEVGVLVQVKKVHGQGALKRRLMDMGIIPGAKMTVNKLAPLGDPAEVTLRGYHLTLRKEESECIEII